MLTKIYFSQEKDDKKETELEKYWKAVKDNPADFTGWTYLLQYVEQEVSGYTFYFSYNFIYFALFST